MGECAGGRDGFSLNVTTDVDVQSEVYCVLFRVVRLEAACGWGIPTPCQRESVLARGGPWLGSGGGSRVAALLAADSGDNLFQ